MTAAGREPTGGLLVDKPSGPTSHDVVAFTRRLLHTSRVGHTGTLDPLATGLLVLLVGPATRLARFLSADEKEYLADVRLGVATRTYDAASLDETAIRCPITDNRWPMDMELERALERFRGSFLQTPPPYSAKKIGGVAAYEKARRNEAVELKPVPVTVRELHVLRASDIGYRTSDFGQGGLVRLRVAASSGFYVRSLAHDLGQALGCGAHLEALRRTRVGRFRIEDAATLEALQADGPAAAGRLVSMHSLLSDFPAVTLTLEGRQRAAHGNPLNPAHLERGDGPLFSEEEGGFFRVIGADGEVVAVAEARADGLLHPLVVLG